MCLGYIQHTTLFNFILFFVFLVTPGGRWKFPNCCSDNMKSLTHWATRQLHIPFYRRDLNIWRFCRFVLEPIHHRYWSYQILDAIWSYFNEWSQEREEGHLRTKPWRIPTFTDLLGAEGWTEEAEKGPPERRREKKNMTMSQELKAKSEATVN